MRINMDNCKYRHILFLSYKDICYNSTSYFEQRISEELINAGIKVTHLNIPKPAKGLSGTLADTAYMLLKPYFNADLDAIIDINTTIPVLNITMDTFLIILIFLYGITFLTTHSTTIRLLKCSLTITM